MDKQTPQVLERDSQFNTHPAFGCVSVSRPEGGNYQLFGSELFHNRCVTLRISTALSRRQFNEDTHHPDKFLMEFSMSESQWNHMIATPNTYVGTPITFTRLQPCDKSPVRVPGIENPSFTKKFETDIRKNVMASLRRIKTTVAELTEEVENPKLSKKTLKDIAHNLNTDLRLFVENTVFIQTMLSEQVEKQVHEAKVQMEAYFDRRMGELKTTALQAEKEGRNAD